MESKKLSFPKIVSFGVLKKQHGFDKAGVTTLRMDLFHRGGALFQSQKSVFVGESLHGNPPVNFQEISLVQESAPSGGKWSEATGVLLKFATAQVARMGLWVGLSLENFPDLGDQVYLCDLLGREVVDEAGVLVGRVLETHGIKGAINLEISQVKGPALEVPLAWAAKESILQDHSKPLVVPNIKHWMNLE